MDFSPGGLMMLLVTGSVGFGYFQYGRKRPAPVFLAAGLLLMTYTYVVESVLLQVGIGLALAAAPFLIRIEL